KKGCCSEGCIRKYSAVLSILFLFLNICQSHAILNNTQLDQMNRAIEGYQAEVARLEQLITTNDRNIEGYEKKLTEAGCVKKNGYWDCDNADTQHVRNINLTEMRWHHNPATSRVNSLRDRLDQLRRTQFPAASAPGAATATADTPAEPDAA